MCDAGCSLLEHCHDDGGGRSMWVWIEGTRAEIACARALYESGERERGCQLLAAPHAEQPENVDVVCAYGEACLGLGQVARAQQLFLGQITALYAGKRARRLLARSLDCPGGLEALAQQLVERLTTPAA